jgi:lipid-A-disaccharide synthase
MSDLITSSAAYTTFDGDTTRQPRDPAAHTRYEFLLPVASTIDPGLLLAFIETLNAEHLKYFGPEAATLRLTLVPEASEALFHARASVVASGTATVLAAIVGNPFVVVYRVSPITFALAKKLVEYPEELNAKPDLHGNLPVSMVNLIAQRRLIPELLQGDFTAANVASALAPLLADGPERERQMRGLAEVRHRIQPANDSPSGSPIARVADAVVRLIAAVPDV